jgi:hypothetical protein
VFVKYIQDAWFLTGDLPEIRFIDWLLAAGRLSLAFSSGHWLLPPGIPVKKGKSLSSKNKRPVTSYQKPAANSLLFF